MPDILKSPLTITVHMTLLAHTIQAETKILAGVSGGADSMVLLAVLKALGYPVIATHVNFQLRGTESDDDAMHVREYCSANDIPYMEFGIDTRQYSEEHHKNTQTAAREIRYAWWENLVKENHGDLVALAHHHDDAIETFLMNLIRGTGIKGLTGIPVKRDFYIRPLTHVSRSEIEAFAKQFDIPYRTDSSNLSDDYLRNRVRHHLVPQLRELSPSPDKLMEHSFDRIRLEWSAWESIFLKWQKESVIELKNGTELKSTKEEFPFLLRWLEIKGLPWPLSYDYLFAQDAPKGNILQHGEYMLSRMDGGFFFKKHESHDEVTPIPLPGIYSVNDHQFQIAKLPVSEFEINNDPRIAYINISSVTWPLLIRPVEPGDVFQPFGMNGQSKKLQDFLVDLKLPVHAKSFVRVLVSDGKIIWVMGMRLDEIARVDVNKDLEIYRLSYKESD